MQISVDQCQLAFRLGQQHGFVVLESVTVERVANRVFDFSPQFPVDLPWFGSPLVPVNPTFAEHADEAVEALSSTVANYEFKPTFGRYNPGRSAAGVRSDVMAIKYEVLSEMTSASILEGWRTCHFVHSAKMEAEVISRPTQPFSWSFFAAGRQWDTA